MTEKDLVAAPPHLPVRVIFGALMQKLKFLRAQRTNNFAGQA